MMFQKLTEGEIRLLHIHSGSQDAILCDIEVTTLAFSASSYDCLSYIWGSQELSHEISLSGQTYSVTANLHGALRHLRNNDGQHRKVWIDAICINQQDSRNVLVKSI